MPFNIYSTGALMLVIDQVIDQRESEAPLNYFRNRYFDGTPILSRQRRVYFDIVDKARRLAPFVSPNVQGKLMEHRGFSTRYFEPPYLKPKGVVDPDQHLFNRLPGEPIGGTFDLATRRDIAIRELLMEHDDAIMVREELMCMETLRLGQITVTGEGYGTQTLSFGRDGTLTKALTGSNTWDTSGILPLDNIEAWALLSFNLAGTKTRDVFFGTDAWTQFKARLTTDQKKELFDHRRGSRSEAELGPRLPDYIRYEGSYGEFDFYTVAEKYQDEDGNTVDLLPAKWVVGVSPTGLEGRMAYGAVLDPRAGYMPVSRFPKNWINEDPAAEYVMTQAAPLPVPLRPNASWGVQVIE